MDGTYDTQTYGLSVTLTPIQRLYFYNAFTYTHSRTVTASVDDPLGNGQSSIVPYSGDIYTGVTTASSAGNPKTEPGRPQYDFLYRQLWAKQRGGGITTGHQLHTQRVLRPRRARLTARLSCALHYQFSQYDEPSSGDSNNLTAQRVFATLVYKMGSERTQTFSHQQVKHPPVFHVTGAASLVQVSISGKIGSLPAH